MNNYNMRNYNRKRQWYRFRLGLIQMTQHPALFLTLLSPILLAIIFGFVRKKILVAITPSTILEPLFSRCMLFALIVVPILLAVLILQVLGEFVAKKWREKSHSALTISICDMAHQF